MTPNPMDQLALAAVGPLAALILVIGGGIFLAIAARQRWHRATDPAAATRPTSIRRSLALIIAGLSAGAAIIHLAAAPAHFGEIGDLASGFVVAAIFQAIWIRWCLAGPSRGTALVGIAGNLAIVAAWAWTRTVGLPFGELAGTPEPAGYPDVASVVFELLLIAGLVGRLRNVDIAATRRAPGGLDRARPGARAGARADVAGHGRDRLRNGARCTDRSCDGGNGPQPVGALTVGRHPGEPRPRAEVRRGLARPGTRSGRPRRWQPAPHR